MPTRSRIKKSKIPVIQGNAHQIREHLRRNESRKEESRNAQATEVKHLNFSFENRKIEDRRCSSHLSQNHSKASVDESYEEMSSTAAAPCLICHQNHYGLEQPFRDASTAEGSRWIRCLMYVKWSHLGCIRKEQNLPCISLKIFEKVKSKSLKYRCFLCQKNHGKWNLLQQMYHTNLFTDKEIEFFSWEPYVFQTPTKEISALSQRKTLPQGLVNSPGTPLRASPVRSMRVSRSRSSHTRKRSSRSEDELQRVS